MADGKVAFVLGGGGVLGAGRGRHAAGPVPGRHPARPGGRHLDRRGQRRRWSPPTRPRRSPTGWSGCGWASPEAARSTATRSRASCAASPPAPTCTRPGRCAGCWSTELGEHATFADLKVPFRCVAASIERAAEHWFDSGPLVDAVLAPQRRAGAAAAGARSAGEHYVDGGIVNSIPIGEAVPARCEHRSSCCRWAGSSGRSRRRAGRGRSPRWRSRSPAGTGSPADMAALPDDVRVHVLPTGGAGSRPAYATCRRWATATCRAVQRRIAEPRRATAAFLDERTRRTR